MVIDKVFLISTGVIRNGNNKVLLIKRGDGGKTYRGYWQFPEGKKEEGESIETALGREILEEVGLKMVSAKFTDIFVSKISVDEKKYLVVRSVFEVKCEGNVKVGDEHDEYGWFGKDEALMLKLLAGVSEVIERLF